MEVVDISLNEKSNQDKYTKDTESNIRSLVSSLVTSKLEALNETEYFINTKISRNGSKLLFKLDIVDSSGRNIGNGKGNFLSYMIDLQNNEVLFSGMKIENKGNGLGNKLFHFFLNKLKKQGFNKVILNGGKPGVILFFERFGATPYKLKIGKGKNKKEYIYSNENKERFNTRKISVFIKDGIIYIILYYKTKK